MWSSAVAKTWTLAIVAVVGLIAGAVLLNVLPALAQNSFLIAALPVGFAAVLCMAIKPEACLIGLLISRSALDRVLASTSIPLLGASFTFGALLNLIMLILGSVILSRRSDRLQGLPGLRSWIIFLTAGMAASVFSPSPVVSVKLWLNLFSYGVAFALAWTLLEDPKELDRWLMILILSSVVPMLAGNLELIGFAQEYADAGKRIRATFQHPNILAFYLTVPIWAIVMRLEDRSGSLGKGARGWLWLYFMNLIVLLVATKTRGAWFGCWASFLIYAALKRRRWLVPILVAPLAMLAHPAVGARLREAFTGESAVGRDSTSWAWRVELWQASLSEVFKRPFLGYGLATFLPQSIDFSPDRRSVGAHNAYLEIAYEMGFIGLTAFVAVLVKPLVAALHWFSKSLSGEAALAVGAMSAMVLQCVSDNMLQYLSFNWYFWFFMGLILATARYLEPNDDIGNVA